MLLKEQKRLEFIKEKVEKELEDVPEGTLRIGRSNGYVQYYHYKKGGAHNGDYISKNDNELAQQLAQKVYNQNVLKYVDRSLSQIKRLLRNYEDDGVDKIFLQELPDRRKLIFPVEDMYEDRLTEWISVPFNGKEFKDGSPVIRTNKGLRVRSKSEKILADYFDSLGIIYKYECPLALKGYGIVYPDFTFLSPVTGKEIYWEHEGMMDDPVYAKYAVKKIELYGLNGILPGEQLILTFETSNTVLNINLMKHFTKKNLLLEEEMTSEIDV